MDLTRWSFARSKTPSRQTLLFTVMLSELTLAHKASLSKPVAVICQIDGSGIRLASAGETKEIINGISSIMFSQPWKRAPEISDE